MQHFFRTQNRFLNAAFTSNVISKGRRLVQ